MAVEFFGLDDVAGDGPPAVCNVDTTLEVAPLRLDALFSGTCDIHQLHIYQKVSCASSKSSS